MKSTVKNDDDGDIKPPTQRTFALVKCTHFYGTHCVNIYWS